MRRMSRWFTRSRLVLATAIVVLGLAAYTGNVLATAGTGFTGTTIAKATFGDLFSYVHDKTPQSWNELIWTHGNTDMYVQQNTWQPGGTTGWHTHPGPSFIVVTQGSLTVYEGNDPTCTPHVYTANTANNSFVDIGGGAVHLVRNETNAVAQAIAVQLTPAGATRREDAADPGHCSF
jgi:predicted metal-dependent enzyme (double-stranded beta helix superfamily)